MTTQLGTGGEIISSADLLSVWNGAAAEQFVGQELLAYASPYRQPELFYWGREKYNSNAEIDFIIQREGKAIPIEVKAGAPGRMKSLHLFLEQHAPDARGIRFCSAPYKEEKTFTSMPLYAVAGVN
jgi:predicted AAA+ superfamily ATPase